MRRDGAASDKRDPARLHASLVSPIQHTVVLILRLDMIIVDAQCGCTLPWEVRNNEIYEITYESYRPTLLH
jgi:hypothetical protein